jgi:hypothetical protein
LTKNEAAFFRVLQSVIGGHFVISCKVRLADIVTCNDQDWKQGRANRISQKHIDFVIASADSSRIIAAIELDDRTHRRPERRRRDEFVDGLLKQIDVRLIRVPASWRYSRQSVEEAVEPIWLSPSNQAR